MVVFTCSHCGDSLRKPTVEKHYQTRCRARRKNVSCMDCLKDFYDEEYAAHTKCISEAERYSGKDYVHKESTGAKKQETWIDIIRSILETDEYQLTAAIRQIFERLKNFDNVPRKKVKFINFVSNSFHIDKRQIEPVWSILEKELEKMKQSNQIQRQPQQQQQEQNGLKRSVEPEQNSQNEPTKKKSKKQQAIDPSTNGDTAVAGTETAQKKELKKSKVKTTNSTANGDEVPVANAAETEPATEKNREVFAWIEVLQKVVQKNSNGILLEKLKKKILKRYQSNLGLPTLGEKQQKKFEKKFEKNLKKCTTVKVECGIATPCH